MEYERFHAVCVQCFCESIYIWARFINIFSIAFLGAPKSARYIYICFTIVYERITMTISLYFDMFDTFF